MKKLFTVSLLSLVAIVTGYSQGNQPSSSRVQTIEIKSPAAEAEVGKPLKFTAVVKDASGKTLSEKPSAWFAAPFDLAHAQDDGTVTFFQPGEVLVGAIVGGKPGFTKIMVKTTPIARIDIDAPKHSLVVGGRTKLTAIARSTNGDPRKDAVI